MRWLLTILWFLFIAGCSAVAPQTSQSSSVQAAASESTIGLPLGYAECLAPAVQQPEKEKIIVQCRRYLDAFAATLSLSQEGKQALTKRIEADGRAFVGAAAPASSTSRQQLSSQREARPNMLIWVNCVSEKIPEIDDRTSGPDKVAVTVMRACRGFYGGEATRENDMTAKAIVTDAIVKWRKGAWGPRKPLPPPPKPEPPAAERS